MADGDVEWVEEVRSVDGIAAEVEEATSSRRVNVGQSRRALWRARVGRRVARWKRKGSRSSP